MLEDKNKKESKEYSFIQEQITSKKKSRLKRMLYSVVWNMLLACIFGVTAGAAFCIAQPAFSKLLGINIDKKTIEFPSQLPDEHNDVSVIPTPSIPPEKNEDIYNNSNDNQDEDPDSLGNDEKDDEDNDNSGVPSTVVVEKYVKADINDLSNMYYELKTVVSKVNKSIVTVNSISSGVDLFNNEYEAIKTTSGLILANNGSDWLILVSLDRIKEANQIKVNFTDKIVAKARLQDYDSDLNLAIIAVKTDDLYTYDLSNIKPANLGESYSLSVGTPIIALGSPNGYVGSMEFGIVSSKGTSVPVTDNKIDTFNTDISYNENGDGVIVNLYGEVVGIITNHLKDDLSNNVNTVIGISKITKIIESLVNNTDRVYFGIKAADMTEDALIKAGIDYGICVTEVEASSPALEAGIQSGDIITAIDNTPVKLVSTFNGLLSKKEPKNVVKVSFKRNTKNVFKDMELNVVLDKKND